MLLFPVFLLLSFVKSSSETVFLTLQNLSLCTHLYCRFRSKNSMHIIYTVIQKRWQYICDHNSGKSQSIFIFFVLLLAGRNIFTHIWKNVHLIKITYLCYLVKMKSHILYLYTHRILPTTSSMPWNIRISVTEKTKR